MPARLQPTPQPGRRGLPVMLSIAWRVLCVWIIAKAPVQQCATVDFCIHPFEQIAKFWARSYLPRVLAIMNRRPSFTPRLSP